MKNSMTRSALVTTLVATMLVCVGMTTLFTLAVIDRAF